MTFKEFWKREKFVIINGQTVRFRIYKYLALAVVLGLIFWVWGFWSAVKLLAALIGLGVVVHFIFRYKTKGWTENWGPYKKMDLP